MADLLAKWSAELPSHGIEPGPEAAPSDMRRAVASMRRCAVPRASSAVGAAAVLATVERQWLTACGVAVDRQPRKVWPEPLRPRAGRAGGGGTRRGRRLISSCLCFAAP